MNPFQKDSELFSPVSFKYARYSRWDGPVAATVICCDLHMSMGLTSLSRLIKVLSMSRI